MRRWPFLALLIVMVCLPVDRCFASEASIVEVKKIWDAGQHNAFTDLTRFHDRWWCTFREAEDHVGGDGQIRVLTSADGEKWESAAASFPKPASISATRSFPSRLTIA